MIPPGVPTDAGDWPDGLLEHLRRFEQGHLVEGLPFFYFTSMESPVFGGAGNAGLAAPLVWEAEDFRYGIIATQTCDLREEDVPKPKQPWFHCCPIYRADDPDVGLPHGQAGQAQKGTIPHYLWIPDLPEEGIWVADLRILIPIDKSWLLDREPIDGFGDEQQRLQIGRRLALIHSRPAFDGTFAGSVSQPLLPALRGLAKDRPDLFDEMTAKVYALAVRSDRLAVMNLEAIDIRLLCWQELSDEARAFWEAQWEQWAQEALRSADHRLTELRIQLLRDLSAEELLALQVVPIHAMTPHPLWYAD